MIVDYSVITSHYLVPPIDYSGLSADAYISGNHCGYFGWSGLLGELQHLPQ
jgi:hypothetical protein